MRGLAALGAVHAFQALGETRHIRMFVGTSIGSLVCAALAVRKNPKDVMAAVAHHHYEPDYDFAGVYSSFGLDSGKNLLAWIRDILGRDYTFEQIYEEFGTRLVICVSNITKARPEYFSVDTHPDLDVATAVRMSCSVPLYFAAVRYRGDIFADGCLVDNFPVDWALGPGGARKVLAIRILNKTLHVNSLDSYILALVACTLRDRDDPAPGRATILDVEAGDVGTLSLDLSPQDRKALFKSGARQARLFMKKNN